MLLGTLTIVGAGLIGGSIGLAAKERGVARRVFGVGRRRESLRHAQTKGAIDEGYLEFTDDALSADMIVFCTPVHMIANQVIEAGTRGKPGTIMTDAGSTKGQIISAIEGRLPKDVHFVGSHPLAGSEKKGPEHAQADLFDGRLTIVTPTAATDPNSLVKVLEFWRALGCRTKQMTPQAHDEALAFTSHLPHLVASALAGGLPKDLKELTATGFRDSTRVAAGDPEMWTHIFLHNREAVLAGLAALTEHLERFRTAVARGDESTLHTLLHQAKKVRDALGS